jgi:catechol 2,3-dioxygenase-like lactoylglutathione lyase family enzyme
MLTDAPVIAVLATTDIGRARQFYEERLGLSAAEVMDEMRTIIFECGAGTRLLVYERATAGDSEATSAAFRVDDVEQTVEDLRAAGVEIEEYDLPGIKTENGVAALGDFKSAWFKDPDGNIISVSN